jgi:hypothetical protein
MVFCLLSAILNLALVPPSMFVASTKPCQATLILIPYLF